MGAPVFWNWVMMSDSADDSRAGVTLLAKNDPDNWLAKSYSSNGLGTGTASPGASDQAQIIAASFGVPYYVVIGWAAGRSPDPGYSPGPAHSGVDTPDGLVSGIFPYSWYQNVKLIGTGYRNALVSALQSRQNAGKIQGLRIYTGPPPFDMPVDNPTLDAAFYVETQTNATPAIDVLCNLDYLQSPPAAKAITRFVQQTSIKVIAEAEIRRDAAGSRAWFPLLRSSLVDTVNLVDEMKYGPGPGKNPVAVNQPRCFWTKAVQRLETGNRPALIFLAFGSMADRVHLYRHYANMGYDVWGELGDASTPQVQSVYQWYSILGVAIDSGWTPSLDSNGFVALGPDRETGVWASQPVGGRLVYVSSSTGNDSNPGTAASPKATIAAALAMLRPGFADWVLLKRGDTWTQTASLTAQIKGVSAGVPSGIGAYGQGARPIVSFQQTTVARGLVLTGGELSDFVIRDLDIRVTGNPFLSGSAGITISNTGDRGVIENCVVQQFADGIKVGTFAEPFQTRYRVDDWIRRNVCTDQSARGIHADTVLRATIEENAVGVDTAPNADTDPSAVSASTLISVAEYSRDVRIRKNTVYNTTQTGIASKGSGKVEDNIVLQCRNGIVLGRIDNTPDVVARRYFTFNTEQNIPWSDDFDCQNNVIVSATQDPANPAKGTAVTCTNTDFLTCNNTIVGEGDGVVSQTSLYVKNVLVVNKTRFFVDDYEPASVASPNSWATFKYDGNTLRNLTLQNIELQQKTIGGWLSFGAGEWPPSVTGNGANISRVPDITYVDYPLNSTSFQSATSLFWNKDRLSYWPNVSITKLMGSFRLTWDDVGSCWGFIRDCWTSEDFGPIAFNKGSDLLSRRASALSPLGASSLLENVPASGRPRSLTLYGFTGRLGLAAGNLTDTGGLVPWINGLASTGVPADLRAQGCQGNWAQTREAFNNGTGSKATGLASTFATDLASALGSVGPYAQAYLGALLQTVNWAPGTNAGDGTLTENEMDTHLDLLDTLVTTARSGSFSGPVLPYSPVASALDIKNAALVFGPDGSSPNSTTYTAHVAKGLRFRKRADNSTRPVPTWEPCFSVYWDQSLDTDQTNPVNFKKIVREISLRVKDIWGSNRPIYMLVRSCDTESSPFSGIQHTYADMLNHLRVMQEVASEEGVSIAPLPWGTAQASVRLDTDAASAAAVASWPNSNSLTLSLTYRGVPLSLSGIDTTTRTAAAYQSSLRARLQAAIDTANNSLDSSIPRLLGPSDGGLTISVTDNGSSTRVLFSDNAPVRSFIEHGAGGVSKAMSGTLAATLGTITQSVHAGDTLSTDEYSTYVKGRSWWVAFLDHVATGFRLAGKYGTENSVVVNAGVGVWRTASGTLKDNALARARVLTDSGSSLLLGAGPLDVDVADDQTHWTAALNYGPYGSSPNNNAYNAYQNYWDAFSTRTSQRRVPMSMVFDGIAIDVPVPNDRPFSDWQKYAAVKIAGALRALSASKGVVVAMISNVRSLVSSGLIEQAKLHIRSLGAIPALTDSSTAAWDSGEPWVSTSGALTPLPPSNLRVTRASGAAVTFAWVNNDVAPAQATSIQITYANNNSFTSSTTTSLAAGTSTFDVPVGTPGDTMYAKVRAVNLSGNSAYSNVANGYSIASASGLSRSLKSAFTIQGLTPSTPYFAHVRARNTSGTSSFSGNVSFTTLAETIPAPTNLILVATGPRQIDANWSINAVSATSQTLQYSVNADFSSSTSITVPANTPFRSITGLTPNTTYYVRVRANGIVESSAWLTTDPVTTPTGIPVAPSGLLLTALSGTQLVATWTDNSTDESQFRLQIADNAGFSSPTDILVAAGTSTQPIGSLSPNTLYYTRVRAENQYGNSAYSPVASASTLQVPPNAPSNLLVGTVTTTSIDVSWTDNSTTEASFRLEWSETIDFVSPQGVTLASNTTTYSVTGLAPNSPYFFRVKSVNSSGSSDFTPIVSAFTNSNAPLTLTPNSPVFPASRRKAIGPFEYEHEPQKDTPPR